MARNNEPAFRPKTPLLICSIRTEIPYPCMGSSANVFRMSISSVPWPRSLGLSGINLLPLGYQEEDTLLPLVVKRRNTWAGNCQAWRGEFELLVTQRHHGIDSRGASSGNPCRSQCHGEHHTDRAHQRRRIAWANTKKLAA